MDIQESVEEESFKAFPIFLNVKGYDCNQRNRQDWVDACNKGVEIMRVAMEDLKDFDTWKEWININPIVETEWDDSHELNNVMNQMVDDIFPELTTKEYWQQIDFNTEEYSTILYKTQNIKPIDYGSTLDSRYSRYEFGEMIYELTWDNLLTNSTPIIKRKQI